jgi:hypothetical protein
VQLTASYLAFKPTTTQVHIIGGMCQHGSGIVITIFQHCPWLSHNTRILLIISYTFHDSNAALLCAAFILQVHLFSGGGFIFMGWVFQILAELEPHNAQAADVRARIRGVVFDSSPADVTAGGRLLLLQHVVWI